MAPYDKVRPNYYREWLRLKKRSWVELIVNRLKEAHQKGLISEEESKIEPKMSTKDRLKKLGINVGISDIDSLGSFGDDNLSTGAEDYNAELLESEEEDPFNQDEFKGVDLGRIRMRVGRKEMTRAERRAWLDDDGNGKLFQRAMNERLDPAGIQQRFDTRQALTKSLREKYITKNDI